MTVALELDGLRKRFGVVEALAGASMRVRSGTVHALLGENGAGKTTLMRVVYGTIRADAGSVFVDGAPAAFRTSADAIARGIGMVHQHFTLVPAMTVAENVALGMRGRYDARAAIARVRDLGASTGLVLDPEARVETLPVGAQQRLEIIKALAHEARLLILDEPTAVLAPDEADDLMRWVRRYRDAGHAVVLITHKLREALAIADDVTVLRRGTTVLTGSVAALDEPTLIAALLGEASVRDHPTPPFVGEMRPVEQRARVPSHAGLNAGLNAGPNGDLNARPVAQLRNVSVANANRTHVLHDVTLDVHAGEILGVAAIEGSGQHELVRVLAGRLMPTSGTVHLPHAVAFIPEDRHRHAMALDMSLVENVALRGLSERRGRMGWRALHDATRELIARFDVRTPGPLALARELSGGNQQKLILGRELSDHPEMIVAENPTRGLDIRATAAVQNHLRVARNAGSAVVLYSSDLDEVLSLADRLMVVHAGRVVHVEHPTRVTVGRAMLGAP